MKLIVEQARRGIWHRRDFLAESFLPFIQAAWRKREGETSLWKRDKRLGGPTRRRRKTELADYGCVRRVLEDRHALRAIISYYSGDLDTKSPAPHGEGGCKASYCWNRFHAAALRIAWHNGGPR
jgi:hypothetical protein